MNVFAMTLDSSSRSIPNKAIEFILGDDDWLRLFDGRFYLIGSEKSPAEIYNQVQKVIHDDDVVYIAKLKLEEPGSFAARIPSQAWDWLEKYTKVIRKGPGDLL